MPARYCYRPADGPMDETFPDLGSLSDDELKRQIGKLVEDEQQISHQRRMLHGKIDIFRAELVNRLRKKREKDGGEWPPADLAARVGSAA
jgi:hypothetical protein